MWYAEYVDSEPIYKLDDDGNRIVADTIDGVDYFVEIGRTEPHYTDPIPFDGTIKTGGRNVEYTEYGINTGEYDAIMVLMGTSLPIKENTLIWVDIEPTEVSEDTADYKVVRKTVALNTTRFVLKKVVS